MRFASVEELKQKTMDILKESEKGDIIVTAYGKPVAILHHINDDDLADYLVENDPAFRNRIEEAAAEYAAGGGISARLGMGRLILTALFVRSTTLATRARCRLNGKTRGWIASLEPKRRASLSKRSILHRRRWPLTRLLTNRLSLYANLLQILCKRFFCCLASVL